MTMLQSKADNLPGVVDTAVPEPAVNTAGEREGICEWLQAT